MNTLKVKSQIITTTTTIAVSSIIIRVGTLELGKSVSLMCHLIGDNDTYIDIKQITLSGLDYEGWGSDDDYITTIVLKKLGLTIDT